MQFTIGTPPEQQSGEVTEVEEQTETEDYQSTLPTPAGLKPPGNPMSPERVGEVEHGRETIPVLNELDRAAMDDVVLMSDEEEEGHPDSHSVGVGI